MTQPTEAAADEREQPACPHCNTLSLTKRAPKPTGQNARTDAEYYCRRCGRHVDDPVWRTRNHPRTRTPTGTVARKLEDADPGDLVTDGGQTGYVAECEQCGVIEDGDLETVGDAIEDHDQFHDVQIQRAVTDGGRSLAEVLEDGYDEWCDWCQTEFQNGPTYRVEGEHITGYFCSRGCAEQWKSGSSEVERIDQPDVRTDGGQRTPAPSGGATNPGVDTTDILEILHDDRLLYYASGNSTTGSDRTFHVAEDCRRLNRAKNTRSCAVDHRPRGHLCSECAPGITLSAIDAAIETGDLDA